MFNSRPNSQEEEDSTEQTSETGEVIAEGADLTAESEIHTMPGRFLQPAKMPKKKGKISWLILGILIFVVLGGVISVVVIYLGQQSSPPIDLNPAVNLNQIPAGENANTNSAAPSGQNQNQNQNVNQSQDTAQERDKKRLEDIADIRTALSLYFSTRHVYPNALNILADEFLTGVPMDPLPDKNYQYLTATDQLNYQLSFTLESGGVLGPVRLTSGDYVATADLILTKEAFTASNNQNQNQNSNVNQSPPPAPVRPALGLDSDGDQLTDIEENIYRTNSALADTDGDSFTDAVEILNFFDPTIVNGRLMDSGLIEVYQNTAYNYSLLYPKSWVARSLTADNKEVIFTSSTGEFVEIIIQDNPLTLSAYNWYINQNPAANASEIASLIIDGLPAIQTPDGLTTFLAAGTKIYTIAYNIGTQSQMNFNTTYQLFLKSFMFIQPASANNP